MQPALTRHAQTRMQQRAIRPEVLERLLEFGREAFDHNGGNKPAARDAFDRDDLHNPSPFLARKASIGAWWLKA